MFAFQQRSLRRQLLPGITDYARRNRSVRVQLFVYGETALREAASESVDHDPRWHKDTP
jgi:hypothetical protein